MRDHRNKTQYGSVRLTATGRQVKTLAERGNASLSDTTYVVENPAMGRVTWVNGRPLSAINADKLAQLRDDEKYVLHPNTIIKVTGETGTVAYGTPGYAPGYVVDPDMQALRQYLTGSTVLDPVYSDTDPVGTVYTVTQGTLAVKEEHRDRYTLSYDLGRVEIVPAPIAVPVPVAGLVYDGSEQRGVPAGEGYTVSGGSAVDAGEHTAKVRLLDGFVWADGGSGEREIKWSILPAPLTVTADSVFKRFGETDPVLTYRVEGLQGGDVLTGVLERVPGEKVGEYGITLGSLAPVNKDDYVVGFVPATFTVGVPIPSVPTPGGDGSGGGSGVGDEGASGAEPRLPDSWPWNPDGSPKVPGWPYFAGKDPSVSDVPLVWPWNPDGSPRIPGFPPYPASPISDGWPWGPDGRSRIPGWPDWVDGVWPWDASGVAVVSGWPSFFVEKPVRVPEHSGDESAESVTGGEGLAATGSAWWVFAVAGGAVVALGGGLVLAGVLRRCRRAGRSV